MLSAHLVICLVLWQGHAQGRRLQLFCKSVLEPNSCCFFSTHSLCLMILLILAKQIRLSNFSFNSTVELEVMSLRWSLVIILTYFRSPCRPQHPTWTVSSAVNQFSLLSPPYHRSGLLSGPLCRKLGNCIKSQGASRAFLTFVQSFNPIYDLLEFATSNLEI